jgi:transaldolase
MNPIQTLHKLGQSIWIDYIERGMVQSGELKRMVDLGVRGVTSNPTIFQQAISKSDAYKDDLQRLAKQSDSPKEIFETLAIADIQAAADVLSLVYKSSNGHDGFVSLEVAPDLALDTEATIAEARRLHQAVNRPNLMVKVPATLAGLPAIRQLIADGININVTLIFSLERYAAVMDAYISGLEQRQAVGQAIDNIASVASFFISRVDSAVDSRLEKSAQKYPEQAEGILALRGKIALANAKLAYHQFQRTFTGTRWETLASAGAQLQRPLWASTSTKNPEYPDLLYVDNLIGPHTVNTMPLKTFEDFQDHGVATMTVDLGVEEAEAEVVALAKYGISLTEVTDELEQEGVQKFADSYTELLETIVKRRAELVAA